MKLCRYILAVFLSAQIILLGVGQTRILYRCIKCAKSTNNIFVRIETGAYNDGSCSCGAGGCACEGGGGCACGERESEEAESHHSCGSTGCATMKIHKLEMPTLAQSLCLDHIYFPTVQLCADPYLSFLISALPERQQNFLYYDTAAPLPKGYLHKICVLLI
ncbi:hypothetical protein [Odoribacter laneus]|uniref:hypothetical protein n=1 Tax=Odoribacter laneus TaxID=626933 RepID=UPI003AF7E90B